MISPSFARHSCYTSNHGQEAARPIDPHLGRHTTERDAGQAVGIVDDQPDEAAAIGQASKATCRSRAQPADGAAAGVKTWAMKSMFCEMPPTH